MTTNLMKVNFMSKTTHQLRASKARLNSRPDWALRTLPMMIASVFGTAVHAAPPAATALPVGAQVVAGSAAISQTGATLQIQQATQKMIANWQSFDIGKDATVQFIQPNASAVALNRVMSGDPSQIFGVLRSNGQVFLINPSGVLFGASARVDVGGLMASTHQMSNEDFLSGKYQLDTANPLGKIQNFGQLVASQGGYVTLIANQVENAGQILAPGGQVVLAAGESARLNLGVTGLVGVDVKGGDSAARIDNTGLVAADGGAVYLTAKSAAPMLATAVNQNGVVRANSVAMRNGEIHIEAQGGVTTVAGQVQANGLESGTQGGRVAITGDGVHLQSTAVVTADGAAGGGEVLVGGGWQGQDARVTNAQHTFVNKGSQISASATENGNGGTVVLWSEQATGFSGDIKVTGAAGGKGGQVETSSKGRLGVTGTVTTGGGNWLLDPQDIWVVSSGGDEWWDQGWYSNVQDMWVSKSSIESTLNASVWDNQTSVTLWASRDIYVNADISKISGADAGLIFAADRNITINNAVSSISNRLHVDFGQNANQSGGWVYLNNSVATNGGAINFFKNTRLAHATPISTKITQLSDAKSGNVTFHQQMELAAPGYAVTINTQGPQSGANYTGQGGDVYVAGNIYSQAPDGLPRYPQALTIDTTGADTAISYRGPGRITLGAPDANTVIGDHDTFGLRSLTLRGPMDNLINAREINIFSTSGDVITLASNLRTASELPRLVLGATDTIINVTGGTFGSNTGYTDYIQSTFDIARSFAKQGVDQSLTINSDRSIKMRTGTNIDGTMLNVSNPDAATNQQAIEGFNTAEGRLTVNLNPFRSADAVGGGIVMDRANIFSNGGDINLGTSANRATGFGADAQLQTDGIYLTNAKLDSRVINQRIEDPDGHISLYGAAPLTTDAGSGVRMVGALTDLNAGYGNITIDGNVSNFAASGNKDAVIIGEGGSSRVTVQTLGGYIAIKGDARMPNVLSEDITGGSRYNGVNISSRALISTDSGAITVEGFGGGFDKFFISENHGVKLADTNTSIVSNSGNILIKGTTGGKTSTSGGANSFGVYAAGVNMYLGSGEEAYDPETKLLTSEGPTASGVITLVGDSMNFVNTASTHLKAASTGELRLHTENADTKIEFGTAGGLFDPIVLDQKTQYLGSNWFNGSANGIFQPGFRNIVVGNAVATNPANVSTGLVSTTGNTNTLTVAAATILRDETVLETIGNGGNIRINQDISVGSTGAFNDKALTLNTNNGAIGAGAIKTDQLTLLGSGRQVLTGANLVNVMAADVSGDISVRNLKTLEVGRTTVKGWMDANDESPAPNPNHTTVTTGVVSDDHNVVIRVTGGDIVQTRKLDADTAQVLLSATRASNVGGAIVQSGADAAGVITAGSLQLLANNGIELAKTNRISADGTRAGGLAAQVTVGDLVFKNQQGLNLIDSIVAVPSASATATVTEANSSVSGVTTATSNASSRIDIVSGDLTQQAGANLVSDRVGVSLNGQIALTNAGNVIRTLAVQDTGAAKQIDVRSSVNLSVGSVNSTALGQVVGVSTNNGQVLLTTDGALTIDQNIAAGTSNIRLQALGGDVSQNDTNDLGAGRGNLTGNNLQVYASEDVVLRNRANQVNAVSGRANTGVFTYTDANALTVNDSVAITAVTNNTAGVPSPYNATGFAASTGVSAAQGVELSTVTGNLGLSSRVDASTGYARLVSQQGSVSQLDTGTAQLTAGSAVISAKTSIDMRNASNDVATLAAVVLDNAGKLAYVDANSLTIGSVNAYQSSNLVVNPLSSSAAPAPVHGVKTTNGELQIKSLTGNLSLNQSVQSGTANTLLEATTGALAQNSTGVISASGLLARGAAGVDLSQAANAVSTVAGATTDSGAAFNLNNTGALTVGALASGTNNVVLGASGIQTNAGVVTVNNSGNLTIGQAVMSNQSTASGANVNLTSATGNIALAANVNAGTQGLTTLMAEQGAVTQSAGQLDADKVQVKALGLVDLDSTGNAINTLAARTTGANQTITFVNSKTLIVGDAGTTSGVTTNSGRINLTTLGASSDLGLNKPVNAGDDVVDLNAGRHVAQNAAGTITAGQLRARAGETVTLKNDANRVDVLAGSAPKGFAFYNSVDLEVGSVAGTQGVTATDAVLGRVDIQARGGDLTLTQQVTGNGTNNTWGTTDGTGNAAVILRATGRFYNDVGANAIDADNGRWLVYDHNPLLLDKDMNGLVRNHLIPNTRYGDLLPTSVRESGDAYITTAEYVTPAQLSRSVGGNAMGENFTHTSNSSAGGMSPIFKGDPASLIQRPATAILNTSAGFTPTLPVVIMVQGQHFQSSLASLAGLGAIESATLADGKPLPAWLKLDAAQRKLIGSVPASTRGAVPLKLKVRDPGARESRELQLNLQVSMAR